MDLSRRSPHVACQDAGQGAAEAARGDDDDRLFAQRDRLGYSAAVRRVVQLPDRGRLIVGTDVQGNVTDFDRIAAIFEEATAREPDGAYLVVTGDLVHGPELTESQWPDYLGSFYRGDSKTVLEHARALLNR